MFDYIRGKLVSTSINSIVVENNGIGYFFNASNQTIIKAEREIQGQVKLYAYLHVREDELSLFGFYSVEEREMFLNLISVSGIGPKMAIQILSGMELKDLALSIATGDAVYFTRIKGVGKKTAERIILELREKISTVDFSGVKNTEISGGTDDSLAALLALGFSRAEAARVLSQVDPTLKLEEKITAALRLLGR